jgi:opacity protein-like surface antigen
MLSRGARVAAALAVAATLAALAAPAAADAYLRVITQHAPIYTGPGTSYRTIYTAERGDVYEVIKRGTTGYWFKVVLEDGTTGWIYGELVFPFEVVDDTEAGVFTRMWRATRRAVFAPSPVSTADVEISFSAGALGNEGVFVLRPAWLLESHFALEGFAGLSPQAQQDVFLYGLGWTFRLWPGSALGPHVYAGLGGATNRAKGDAPTIENDTRFALNAGGGFEMTFKKQITVRVDFRNWTVYDPNQARNSQEYSGGLAIFF